MEASYEAQDDRGAIRPHTVDLIDFLARIRVVFITDDHRRDRVWFLPAPTTDFHGPMDLAIPVARGDGRKTRGLPSFAASRESVLYVV